MLANYKRTSVQEGDTIQFGNLNWIVLEVRSGKALLLSEKVLETMAFGPAGEGGTWENSSVREFLNGEFYNNTFRDSEKRRIAETALTTRGQNNTDDKVFLIDSIEIRNHVDNVPEAIRNTRLNLRIAECITTGEVLWWWLRTPGNSGGYMSIGADGRTNGDGTHSYVVGGIRPAIWLYL
jgi:hypothetical protein